MVYWIMTSISSTQNMTNSNLSLFKQANYATNIPHKKSCSRQQFLRWLSSYHQLHCKGVCWVILLLAGFHRPLHRWDIPVRSLRLNWWVPAAHPAKNAALPANTEYNSIMFERSAWDSKKKKVAECRRGHKTSGLGRKRDITRLSKFGRRYAWLHFYFNLV